MLVAAEGHFVDPVSVDLMGHVVVGDGAEKTRVEWIVDFTGAEEAAFEQRDSFGIGGHVDGFGVGVVEIPSEAASSAVAEHHLESVVIATPRGSPGEERGILCLKE